MFRPIRIRHAHGQKGGVTLLMAVGLLAAGAAALSLKLARNEGVPLQRQQLTQERLERIDRALQAHWLSHGCTAPDAANGALADSAAAAGVANAATPAANRVVPWRSLGLQPDDALDAWGRRITFYQAPAVSVDTNGDGVADVTDARWVLVSHGPSGLGAWIPSTNQAAVQQAPFPPVSLSESRNLQGPLFVKTEANAPVGMDPATAPAFFDDVVVFTRTGSLPSCAGGGGGAVVGAPPAVALDSNALKPPVITFSRRGSGKTSVVLSAGALGNLTVSSSGGDLASNNFTSGTALGVCSNRCGGAGRAALSGAESLSFRLDAGKTAGKVAIGLLGTTRRATTVGVNLTFKRSGVVVAGPSVVSASVSRTLPASPQITDHLPSPAVSFDEVVVQAVGSAVFFVSSIRFCAASATCN